VTCMNSGQAPVWITVTEFKMGNCTRTGHYLCNTVHIFLGQGCKKETWGDMFVWGWGWGRGGSDNLSIRISELQRGKTSFRNFAPPEYRNSTNTEGRNFVLEVMIKSQKKIYTTGRFNLGHSLSVLE
jgi:hypothetical protein